MRLNTIKRPVDAHKGTFGTVAILGGDIAGDKIMLGSAAFAAKAALRSGVGMAVFLGQREILPELIKLVPQAVGIVYDGKDVPKDTAWQSVIIGPGLGIEKHNIRSIESLLGLKIPTVIDADGLNIISQHLEVAANLHDQCVLTPHPKELERLISSLRVRSIEEIVRRFDCTIVAKSDKTRVFSAKENWTHSNPNPVLAAAGTGDVLAGLVGGLMAQHKVQGMSIFECACLAVEIHAQAAQKWKDQHGSGGLIIDELLDLIPETMEDMR